MSVPQSDVNFSVSSLSKSSTAFWKGRVDTGQWALGWTSFRKNPTQHWHFMLNKNENSFLEVIKNPSTLTNTFFSTIYLQKDLTANNVGLKDLKIYFSKFYSTHLLILLMLGLILFKSRGACKLLFNMACDLVPSLPATVTLAASRTFYWKGGPHSSWKW